MTLSFDLSRFLEDIRFVCLEHGGSVTSWVRSPARNANVPGKLTSHHLDGTAMDIVFDTPSGLASAETRLRAYGYHTLREADHLHVQMAAPGQKV